jgi:hypothetical protein
MHRDATRYVAREGRRAQSIQWYGSWVTMNIAIVSWAAFVFLTKEFLNVICRVPLSEMKH